ncbi:hypothetical protein [Enterobacter cloacae complex sp. GF14B]|uniref:hypothetical protein n=1 Tax=Enterobacter cloacae complex sp. GF14B TaxID=2511982 RepID=UPI002104E19F|nr:hypothetical protein [Enterobacter cloacae complex sp. GF14B]
MKVERKRAIKRKRMHDPSLLLRRELASSGRGSALDAGNLDISPRSALIRHRKNRMIKTTKGLRVREQLRNVAEKADRKAELVPHGVGLAPNQMNESTNFGVFFWGKVKDQEALLKEPRPTS